MKPAALLIAVLLVSACSVRAPKPKPCCCVLGDHDRNEADYCDPADCERHHGEVD